jgi:hypothetical protein
VTKGLTFDAAREQAMATERERLEDEVLAIIRDVLHRRDSARIIKTTTDRAGLLNE